MAAIKNYTDIEQSRKLAEILPLESADGFWGYHDRWFSEGDEWEGYEDYPRAEPYLEYTRKENEWKEDKSDVPCWSLAALFGSLKLFTTPTAFSVKVCVPLLTKTHNGYSLTYTGEYALMNKNNLDTDAPIEIVADNPIDACYEMIIKLKELNLL